MPKRTTRRLPDVKNLYEMLPKGTEGGKEFARIVDLLLFYEARRNGKRMSIFSDAAGDYYGLDSFEGDVFRKEGTTGYQYKFYPSPLTASHRKAIVDSLKKTAQRHKETKLKKWILVTPQDFVESGVRKDGGDVTWFEGLRSELKLKFQLEHWGHKQLTSLFLESQSLCLFYYPELVDRNGSRKTIEDTRLRYDDNLMTMYRNIEFVGMSVYKPEATTGVPMEHIYIPLTVVPESADEQDTNISRTNPLSFLEPGAKRVILGDPGSGKSTVLRFLALAGMSRPLQERCQAKPDKRLPILIPLRRFADELKRRRSLSLIDYIQECIQGDFNLKSADLDFFEYYLESGQTVLLFDGLDELPNPNFKQIVRDRIRTLVTTYPGNTVLVTSRIVGYESTLRFNDKEFSHFRLTKLELSEMERFVHDWYSARIDNPQERDANVQDLVRILRTEDNTAIRELAENPLLLTIVALVHRIDAVLPDERVVLYQKCTETLLNTWHTWKYKGSEVKNRGREERRNRRRMEAIANWMHRQSVSASSDQRAVVSYKDLLNFLASYVRDNEGRYDPTSDPEDIASEFLEFVKRRAGLLIEVGDERYSFVHQTFQEYLTASYIIATNETKGVDGIWNDIKRFCKDPRWLEVIRLLIAALQSTQGQQTLIENILELSATTHRSSKPQLLGGLLLDAVEPAELYRDEIVETLFYSASTTSDEAHFRQVLGILRTWLAKGNAENQIDDKRFKTLYKNATSKEQQLRLVLIASSLNWNRELILQLCKSAGFSSTDMDLLRFFVFDDEEEIRFAKFSAKIRTLWAAQDFLALRAPYSNFVAAACDAITCCCTPEHSTKRLFEAQLILLSDGVRGPFSDYSFNTLSMAVSDGVDPSELVAKLHLKAPRRSLMTDERVRRITRDLRDLVTQNSTRPSVFATRERLQKSLKSDERYVSLFEIASPNRLVPRDLTQQERQWSNVLASPKLCGHILDTILMPFEVRSLAHWREALRVSFLPTIPRRLRKLFTFTQCQETEKDISSKNIDNAQAYRAAYLLLLDCWLFLMDSHTSSQNSPFRKLARHANQTDHAALRIAVALRKLVYGDATGLAALRGLMKSPDKDVKDLFRSCYWTSGRDSRRKLPLSRHAAKKK